MYFPIATSKRQKLSHMKIETTLKDFSVIKSSRMTSIHSLVSNSTDFIQA